jgi:hypothetical protein
MTFESSMARVIGVEGSRYGRWHVVTALTPIRWRAWAAWLRLVFWFGSQTTVLVGPILKMRVIALGRWTLLERMGRPPAMVFETNWAGSSASYIPDLAMTMAFQWRAIWGGTAGFPGPLPVTGLLAFIARHDCGADHFHTGYADGTTTEIVAGALELDRRLGRFIAETDGLGPLDFARRWDGFLVEVQERL